jgi:hypothetical protein
MGARPASPEAPAPAAGLEAARRNAADAGAAVRLEQGDITCLAELGIAGDYDPLVDLGCYRLVPAGRRDAYVRTVTWAAAPGAILLMLGMGRLGPPGGRRGGPATAVRRVEDHPGGSDPEGSVLEAVPDR